MAHQIANDEGIRLAQVETELKRLGYDKVASLRDEFAMAAMQGMLASCNGPAWGNSMFPLAESAYKYADQMMEARKQ